MGEDKKGFIKAANDAAKQLKEVADEGHLIRCLSHYDADGISSAGILSNAFREAGFHFHISIVRQLIPSILENVASTKPEVVVFSDLGSGHLPLIKKYLNDAKIFVFDHHPIAQDNLKNIVHLNPNPYGISGVDAVAAAGVTYFMAKNFAPKNKALPNLAIVGAMGDRQDKGPSFSLFSLNEDIVKEGVKLGSLTVEEDLRFFGRETRPIHKSLQYTTNPYIPGVSGNNDSTLRILNNTGIPLREGEEWRTLGDLTPSEKKILVSKLVEQIIRKGVDVEVAKNIIGTVYTFTNEIRGTEMRDAREYASLLNACGRTKRGGLGIALASGSRGEIYNEVQQILEEYRSQISSALNWLSENEETILKKGKSITSFFGEDVISEQIIGTIASIVISSRIIDTSKVLIALAQSEENTVKISGRTTPQLVEKGIDIGTAFREALAKVDPEFEAGGHNIAAGARVSKVNRTKFLKAVDKIFTAQLTKK
ncbi:MAG: DHHA1 domain-containing protein [Candidatus Ranarchaeia archaeon]|jgi:RecJ-like exonuclease